jgi:trimeric autotransporter adhesin
VTGPIINVGNAVTGVNMENPLVGITLSVAPTSPVNVTVTTSGPAIATVSNGSTVVGTNSITFLNVSTAKVGTVWIQGQGLGSTTITVSAPGYTSGVGLATVNPSGFVLQSGNFATTHTSPASTIPIYAAVLDPATLAYTGSAQLNPGLSVSVPFTSSNAGAGTIVTSPIPFNGGDGSENATFQPVGVGTTTLTIGTPIPSAGFSTPSQTPTQKIIATVD